MTPLFDRATTQRLAQEAVQALPALDWITDSRVDRLSQDFYWFSPVLQRQLSGLRADAVVRPRSEAEIRAVLAFCARVGLPLTLRGSGTGNHGQCMPLHGGLVLDLTAYDQLLWVQPGVARAQAGIRLSELDRQAATLGQPWELRCVPSTVRSATLGGWFGGGFGGVGSINHGPLSASGNVLGARVMSVEPEPQVLELRAPEALLLHQACGSNGVVLELELALAPAHPWLELVVCFDAFDAALHFADTLAAAPGIVKKSVSLLAAPIPLLLMQALPPLAGSMLPAAHAVLLLVAEFSEPAVRQFVAGHAGRITLRRDATEVAKTQRTLVETTWGHTTLHALRVDQGLTYLQCAFTPGRHLQQAQALRGALGDEVLTHLEFIRDRAGQLTCAGLPLVRYQNDARLAELVQVFRDHGVLVDNPHAYTVEDGQQAPIHPGMLATKQRLDPQGLLNPGKLRGWDERER